MSAPKAAGLTTRGGFPVTLESVNPDDEDAALMGTALKNGESIGVVWRENGEARWVGSDFDLEPEWVERILSGVRRAQT